MAGILNSEQLTGQSPFESHVGLDAFLLVSQVECLASLVSRIIGQVKACCLLVLFDLRCITVVRPIRLVLTLCHVYPASLVLAYLYLLVV